MKSLIVPIFLSFILIFTGCQNKEKDMKQNTNEKTQIEYKQISPSEAKERLESEQNIVLLDVRTKEEYVESHIPGSILIPVEMLVSVYEDQLSDKNTTIIVYCRSGRRSAIAAQTLVDLGYKNVYDLGGIIDWPYETESGE